MIRDRERSNKGKSCQYKGVIHYIVYESDKFVLISKTEDLRKVFSVNPNDIKETTSND
jgi:hypothetical protein